MDDKDQFDTQGKNAAQDPDTADLTRRSFLRGAAGVTLGVAALSAVRYEASKLSDPRLRVWPRKTAQGPYEPHYAEITLNINGIGHQVKVTHHRSLLAVLREDLGLTGTKKSCNLGQCGACTVLMDGLSVYSCFVLAADAAGKKIETIEGLSDGTSLHPIQQAFVRRMGSQCGHCTPGMIMSAVGLLRQNPTASEDDVRIALSGNLCRCGNYPNEVAAVLDAAGVVQPSVQAKVAAEFDRPPMTTAVDILPDTSSGMLIPSPSNIPALDAREKAAGAARYTGDIGWHTDDPVQRPLIAKVIRSPYALATIGDIDDGEARKLPGYRGMVTFRDVPQFQSKRVNPTERSPANSDRFFLNNMARYVGDAIAAIAADDLDTALEAVQRVRVDFRPLQAFPDAEFNLARDIRAIHPGSVAGFGGPQPGDKPTIEYKRGDINLGFKQADLIIEGRYETPLQCHVPIEPHAVVAQVEGERVTLWDSQQSVFAAQDVLAIALGIPRENLRVISHYVGGGFGGKCTDTLGKTCYQAIAAVLSRKTGRAVRLEYTLKELMFAEDTRNPFVFYMKTGVTREGLITALECKAIQRTGGYASSGPAVVSVAGEGIINTYRVPNYWYHGYSVYTSSPVGGECRGFGHPQAVFAREVHMDEVAVALGMDPVEFRRRNSLHTGDIIETDAKPDVQLMKVAAGHCLKAGADAISWGRWEPHTQKMGRFRRGLGMRLSQEHSGRSASNGLVWMDRDGKLHVPIGSGNFGTNSHTGIAVIVANVLGVPVDRLNVYWGDTETSAWDFVSDTSRAIHCHGKAMYNAAVDLRRQLDAHKRGHTAPRTDFTPYFQPETDINPYVDETTGRIVSNPIPKLSPGTEALARKIVAEGGTVGLGFYVWNAAVEAWGASFAEVEVDMETGQVTVLKLVAAHDCGKVIHRPGAEAQVHGGSIMGFGYAMIEELLIDPHSGIPVTQSLYEYRPPSVLDIPPLEPILVEAAVQAGPFGAKGLGENPMLNAAAPIANAIFNATGVRMREIPFTWRRVYDELKQAGKLA